MEFLGIAAKIVGSLFAPVGQWLSECAIAPVGEWLGYSFHHSSNIENLKKQKNELKDNRERVQHRVDDAIRNAEEIEADVNSWFEKVDLIMKNAEQVLEDEEKANTRCSNGTCLNLKQRHQQSKKAKKTVQEIEAQKNRKFDKVSYRPALPGIMTKANKDYMTFDSRVSTVEGLMEALRDANINMIGVWGMSGVGKTTLVREVANQVKEKELFDDVAIAEVTQSLDLRRIQEELAGMLDLKFDIVEPVTVRARRLWQRLTSKHNKILVILDDVWEKLEWEKIGIPVADCKVVITSRNKDLLSCEMSTQENFELGVLTEEEAWNLFEKMAGDSVKDPNLRSMATEVAKECAGLPIALVTVSKALKNKGSNEWKDALKQLRRPAPGSLSKMQSTIYSSIELSCSHLESEEAKTLFLLCSESGYSIGYLDMLKYCYGWGLFPNINTLEEARNRLYRQVRNLRDSSLLLDCLTCHEIFHMHDVVRDAAILIASKDEHNIFMVTDDRELKQLMDRDALKRCRALSIFGGDIHELPNEMECPELRFLHVNGGDKSLLIIPETFFDGMRKLKVLDFTHMQLSSLPSSLLLLSNLTTLCLDYCAFEDMAVIGELKKLEILSLIGSNVSQLPREIGLLTRLRLLDLRDCSKLEVIPRNVLSSLVKLEELYMGNSFDHWETEGLNSGRNNATLAELMHLSHLVTLEIHIRDASVLPRDLLLFKKLERYRICVGDVWDWAEKRETSRRLKLKLNTRFQLECGIKMLLNGVEDLWLDELKGVKSILYELDTEGFQQLKHLHVQNNAEIKYIIYSSVWLIVFPALETFSLKNMINLEEICHGQLHSKSFGNLRVVKFENCNKLKFVFSLSIAKELSQLRELEIRECSIMGAIVIEEEPEIEGKEIDMTLFPQLRVLTVQHLPKLVSFFSTQNSFITNVGEITPEGEHDFPMPILHEQVVFPSLERLELSSISEEIQHNQHQTRSSCKLTNMQASMRFQNLLTLEMNDFGSLKYLLTFSTARLMVQLKHLHISECKVMEEILLTEDLGGEEIILGELFPRLNCMKLKDLPILKRFCVGSNIKFQSLMGLVIEKCPKLKSFIFKPVNSVMTVIEELNEMNSDEITYIATQPLFNEEVAFPSLEMLKISHMENLKIIWHNQVVEDSFFKLKILEVECCENLMNIFQSNMLTRFQSLEKLIVEDCGSLQEIFKLHGQDVREAHGVTTIPLKELILHCLPKMKHVWNKDPQGIFSFQNLQLINVEKCESLKSLFPVSIARILLQLDKLIIVDCGVEEIVASEDGVEATTRFVFPKVTWLILGKLPKLKWFYQQMHTSEWPLLKELSLCRCDQIEIFVSKILSLQEMVEQSQLETSLPPLFLVGEVAFPSLETLRICHMENLKIIWHIQLIEDSFFKLQKLEVVSCENLTNIFQSNMLSRFQSLEKLIVKDCGSLQEIFELEGQDVRETYAARTFPLKELELSGLPKLKNVWNNKDPQGFFSFQNLQKILVGECESLKSLFPASVARCLVQLKELRIVVCGVEEIVASEDGVEATTRFVFPKVTQLMLRELPKLKWFYQHMHTSEWPLLKELSLCGCDQIEIFVSKILSLQEMVEQSQLETSLPPLFLVREVAFPSLETLRICHMENLKIIWHIQLIEDSFFKLQKLDVVCCENLTNIFQSNMLTRFQSLEKLIVADCGSLQEIFELEGQDVRETYAVTTFPLKELELRGLPKLNHVWNNKDPQGIFNFQNLQLITARKCESLKSLFPVSIARILLQLEKLVIVDCGVEEIVASEDGVEETIRFVFPKVTQLFLRKLPKLKWFYQQMHTSEWPLLKELNLCGCDQIEIFVSKILSLQEMVEQSQLETSLQPLFLVGEVAFPSLETLRICHMENLKIIWHIQLIEDSFFKLQKLDVVCCENLTNIFQPNMLTRFQSLKILIVNDCRSLQEIFELEGQDVRETYAGEIIPECNLDFHMPILLDQEKHARVLTKLRGLALTELHMLTHLWKEDTQPSPIFHYLEDLNVMLCGKLKILVPASVSFQNLTNLEILKCHGLINLVTPSTAKSLVQLKKLSVSECESITEVVVGEGGEGNEVITFSQLTYLKLDCLPNLTSFCSRSYSFEFPSLEKVIISKCPEMKIFCHGILSTPKLERVQATKEDEWHWKVDLNTTVRTLALEGQTIIPLCNSSSE